jgi:hypothetical protein
LCLGSDLIRIRFGSWNRDPDSNSGSFTNALQISLESQKFAMTANILTKKLYNANILSYYGIFKSKSLIQNQLDFSCNMTKNNQINCKHNLKKLIFRQLGTSFKIG